MSDVTVQDKRAKHFKSTLTWCSIISTPSYRNDGDDWNLVPMKQEPPLFGRGLCGTRLGWSANCDPVGGISSHGMPLNRDDGPKSILAARGFVSHLGKVC